MTLISVEDVIFDGKIILFFTLPYKVEEVPIDIYDIPGVDIIWLLLQKFHLFGFLGGKSDLKLLFFMTFFPFGKSIIQIWRFILLTFLFLGIIFRKSSK